MEEENNKCSLPRFWQKRVGKLARDTGSQRAYQASHKNPQAYIDGTENECTTDETSPYAPYCDDEGIVGKIADKEDDDVDDEADYCSCKKAQASINLSYYQASDKGG